ncbi:hypothetical protein BH11PSE3_BH11PSE3_24060 [soil metagenome]
MNDIGPPTKAPPEILIVEDSATQAQRLAHILEQDGYQVVVAVNGVVGLEMARRRKPALIISDIVMPSMDGYEMCTTVKADPDLHDVPFILVTSMTDPSEVIRGLECGADSFIFKPYEEEFLIERVRFALLNSETAEDVGLGDRSSEIVFDGKRRRIAATRGQILNLLMSIYGAAMRRNKELAVAEVKLRATNKASDDFNARLQREIQERDKVEQALRVSETSLGEVNARLEQTVADRTAELREATRRHLTLLGNLQGMAYRRQNDADRTMDFVSEGCRALLGVAPADLTSGKVVYGHLIHPDDRERIERKTRETLLTRQPTQYEYRVRHVDGSWRWVGEGSQGIYDEAGVVVAIEGFIADVTERLKLSEQLREAQRMDAIGRLTGGLAHDLNNYLAVIIGNLDLLAERPNADPEAPKLIEGAIGGALRGAELTRSLLAFSRRQPLDPRIMKADERVGEVAKLIERTIGEKITIEIDTVAGLWPVEIDGAQLDSCIVNLANNARDAMPAGGRFRITMRNVAGGGDDNLAGDHVLIEVSDTGAGMQAETVAQAFEPFFTTKGPGHGTGLGLSMVHGFVHQSGGVIRMTSEPGVGTTVRIFLPRVATAGVAATSVSKAAAPAGNGANILVVEDNDHVRATAVEQLVALGYRVQEVESGEAAIALLEQDTAGIDLVFTDLIMPGRIDGFELAKLVLDRWPDKKVLLTSGFSGATAEALKEETRALTVLRKPYRKADLARTVLAALA